MTGTDVCTVCGTELSRRSNIPNTPIAVPLSARVLASIGIVFYAAVVPFLEVNATPVFNPAWVAPARLHEVWQLIANSSLGVFALWCLWKRGDLRTASIINFCLMGGVLLAFVSRDSYGGSMMHEDGRELRFLGMNIAVFGFGLTLLCNVAALLADRQARPFRNPDAV